LRWMMLAAPEVTVRSRSANRLVYVSEVITIEEWPTAG
jgi:hypothetical protein